MRRDKKEVRSGQEAGFSAEPTRIDMQSSTRSSDETARQTSTGRRIVGVLASGLGRRSSSHYSPTGSPNSPSLLARRQFAFPMLAALAVAALGLSLLFLYNSAFAQQTAETLYHQENDEGPVVTLTADDPESVTPIYWSFLTDDTGDQDLPGGATGPNADDIEPEDIAHRDFFKVEDGVLKFKNKPNYEAGAPAPTDRSYKVVVQASDGGLTSWVQYFKVTVNVLDEEEKGKVAWTVDPDGTGSEDAGQDLLEFQAGAILTATVTDPDGPSPVTNITWKWYRSSSKTAMGTVIDDATADAYTVSDASDNNDVGKYLRAVATYTDRRGDNKTAEFVSPYQVKAAKVEENALPVFAPTAVTREVQEGPKGMEVGAAVTATDDDGDVLNYTLAAPIPQVGSPAVNAFEIDQATGQITTAAPLDYEDGTTSYTVIVHATDSAGGESTDDSGLDATVTITLLDVNEAPEFVAPGSPNPEDPNSDVPNNVKGMASDKPEEGVDVAWDAEVSDYVVADPEGVDIGAGKWSLSGADAAKFKLTGATANVRTLEFREKADFEMPGDMNRDNIYEVTVVASDGIIEAMRSVTVKITDSDEAGEIELSTENPVAGTPITATLTDSDGEVINVEWKWHALTDTQVADDAAITTALALTGDDSTAIGKATSDTYTPVAGDIGKHLVAVASYMDRTEDEDNDADTPSDIADFVRFANTAQSVATAAVIDDPANAAPEFVEGERAVRYVEENAESGETIGAPLMIEDDDLPNDSHTYTLGGTDAGSFDIGAGDGQLMTKAELDYEDKDTYTVVVTVEDGSGESNDTDRITVTIEVMDLDEKPGIVGVENIDHEENDTGPVVTLTADDPESVTPIYWSFLTDAGGEQDLPGGATGPNADDIEPEDIAHRDFFKVEGGVLSFKAKPNYEATTPADQSYKVVVQASDGGLTSWVQYFKVTVNVLDEEEKGKVAWTVDPEGGTGTDQDLLEFQAGAQLTATVSDPDGPATLTDVTWKWYRSSSMTAMGTVIDDATAATYDVSDAADNNDVGKYLWAVATYTDRRGPNKTAEFVSPHRVKAAKVEDNALPVFAPTDQVRRVHEGPKGMEVGAPVTATDADGDELNYTLTDPIPQVGSPAVNAFEIDQATGQITTAAPLDYEDGTTSYTVIVHATDSAGGESTDDSGLDATVTITLLDVNEAPEFVAPGSPNPEDPNSDVPNNVKGMASDKPEEGVDVAWDAEVSDYVVADPEGVDIGAGKWSLSGADAAKFKLTGATANVRTLEFREKADFEMPGDKNRDNIYEVTVVASDGTEEAMRFVTVKITDSDEAGEITLSTENPVAGTAVMATLTDSDGDVINVDWTWYALTDAQAADDTSIADAIDGDGTDDAATRKADTGKPDTYTPKAGDIGMHLLAVASYMDRTEDEDNDADTPSDIADFVRFENTARSVATAKVIDDPANAAPEFVEGERAVRYVEEDAASGETIGAPVTATDADNTSHTYTLGGTDAGSFDIGAGTGQLMTKAELDYEDKDTYTVIVTVDDGSKASNATDRITVTIEVKDLDEKPVLTATAGGFAITGSGSVSRIEGSTGTVETYTATAVGATLRLSGDDDDDFTFSNGVLAFRSTPDYEAPTDANEDNVYMVTVTATATEGETTRDVTVTVTNEEEGGMVAAISGTARVDSVLTAGMVTDPDGSVSGERWVWERSMDGTTGWNAISGATSSTYTAVAGDVGYHLRVKVTYTDPEGPRKMATSAMTAKVVAADAVDTVFDRYDDDDSGRIDKSELAAAVFDYEIERTLDKADLAELVFSYEIGG